MRFTTLCSFLVVGMTSLTSAAPSGGNPRSVSQMRHSPPTDGGSWPWPGEGDNGGEGPEIPEIPELPGSPGIPEQPDIDMEKRHWPIGDDNNMTWPFPPEDGDDNGDGDEGDLPVELPTLPWFGNGEDDESTV